MQKEEGKGTLFKCLVVLALEHELGTLKTEINNQRKPSQMLVFDERGKPEYPDKNLSVQRREPTN